MEENREIDSRIKREDEKAIGKFLISMLCSMVIGAIIGVLGVILLGRMEKSGMELSEILEQIRPSVSYISSYVLIVYTVIMLLMLVIRIEKHLKMWKQSNEKNEEQYEADYEKVQRKINYDLLLTNLFAIGSFLLFGLSVNNLKVLVSEHTLLYVLVMVLYMAALVAQLLLQKKIVNQYKKMNPEKQGSLFDTKFHKKWYESSDEAEREAIGRASKKAFEVINRMCLGLEVFLIFASMLFGIGIMAHIVVILIWAVGNIVYALESI